jgi:homoprotocatechuate degradation regulator HpaR
VNYSSTPESQPPVKGFGAHCRIYAAAKIGDIAAPSAHRDQSAADLGDPFLLPSTTRRSLPMTLLRAREVIMAHFRPMLAHHDITEQQWRVLRMLAETGPLEATELANQASILPPSLTRIIRALEERKFLTRSRVKGDGRRTRLAITRAGLALIEELAPERAAIYDAIEKRFGAGEHEKLLDMLEGLIRSQNGEK